MSTISVLHVEDDQALADLIATYLEREHDTLTVESVSSPTTALAELSDNSYDCVVSDYDMPDMNGVTFLRRVRDTYPELPFILFTGKGSEEVASEAISAGVTDYLQKGTGTEQYSLLANRIVDAVSRRRTKQRLEHVIDALPDGLLIVDDTGHIQRINEQLEAMLGYDRADLLGEPIEVLVPDDVADAHVAKRDEYMADPETRPMGVGLDLEAVTATGDRIPVEISLSPLSVGTTLNVIAIVRDMREYEHYEAQLEEKTARLEQLADVLGHDLQNPLSVAQGHLDLLREEVDSEHIDRIDTAHSRMETMINDLLTLAEQGATIGDTQPVALDDLVATCEATIEMQQASIQVDESVTLRADRSRLCQLFENLIANAIEHGGSAVTIRVGTLDDDTGFFVADDGPGIPEAERDQVVQPGYTTAEEGTGLGLNIVQEVAEAHGWSLTITESRSGGARFEFAGVEIVGTDNAG